MILAISIENVFFEILPEIFQCTLQGFHCARGQRTKRISEPQILRMKFQYFQIFYPSMTFFNGVQNFFGPRKAFTARRAESTRLLCEKVLEVFDESDRASLIVQNDHRTRSQSASGSGD